MHVRPALQPFEFVMGVCSTRVQAFFWFENSCVRLLSFMEEICRTVRLVGSPLCAFQFLDKQGESFVCIHCTKSDMLSVDGGTPPILPFVSGLVSLTFMDSFMVQKA